MSEHARNFDVLVARLERLEKHNRWLKRIVLAGLFLAAIVALGRPQPGQAHQAESAPFFKNLVVQNLAIEDEGGKTRAFFTVDEHGAHLYFLDTNRKTHADLSQDAMRLFDHNTKASVRLFHSKKNFALAFTDENGELAKIYGPGFNH